MCTHTHTHTHTHQNTQSSQSFKDSSQSLLGVSEDDEEEDALLLATLLEHLADADDINEKQRSINRFDSFLTLCSLQHVVSCW